MKRLFALLALLWLALTGYLIQSSGGRERSGGRETVTSLSAASPFSLLPTAAARQAAERFEARHPEYGHHRDKVLKLIAILEKADRNDPRWWDLQFEGVYQTALYLETLDEHSRLAGSR